MGTLYLANRVGAGGFSRQVAIKCLHLELNDDPDLVKMFMDEARLMTNIRHPNVVQVDALGEREGFHYIVMELVEGAPLTRLLNVLHKQQRILAPSLAVFIAIELTKGLQATHEATDKEEVPLQIVHRDVTPHNILVSKNGNVKLIDFGVAKSRLTQTVAGMIKGKFRYMSPEQAFGKTVDARTDVYAVGIVLYELLTGRRRFSAKTDIELLEKVRHPNRVDPSRYNPLVSERLDAVIAKAMAPEADDRYASARDLRAALRAACADARDIESDDLGNLLREALAEPADDSTKVRPVALHAIETLTHHLDELAALREMNERDVTPSEVRLDADNEELTNPDDDDEEPLLNLVENPSVDELLIEEESNPVIDLGDLLRDEEAEPETKRKGTTRPPPTPARASTPLPPAPRTTAPPPPPAPARPSPPPPPPPVAVTATPTPAGTPALDPFIDPFVAESAAIPGMRNPPPKAIAAGVLGAMVVVALAFMFFSGDEADPEEPSTEIAASASAEPPANVAAVPTPTNDAVPTTPTPAPTPEASESQAAVAPEVTPETRSREEARSADEGSSRSRRPRRRRQRRLIRDWH